MFPIIQNYIKQNRSYESLQPIGIVLHETADPGATAANAFAYFNSSYAAASAHAFVDWTSIIQTVPWNEVAWHAGPTANHRFIGIELCRPAEFNEDQFNEVWNRGIWLFAHIFQNILKITDVTPDNLLSHANVSLLWGQTDHQDPIAYFNEYGKTVDDFRNAVQQEINKANEMTPNLKDIQGHWAEKDIASMLRKGVIAGYEDGSYKPDQPLTRAEAAVLASRIIRYILGDD